MEEVETLRSYYERTNRSLPYELQSGNGAISHFNVMRRNACVKQMPFNRRDFYKICLNSSKMGILTTENGVVSIDQPAIIFSNPMLRFGWQNMDEKQDGFVCVFNDLYLNTKWKRELKTLSPLFNPNLCPYIFLTDEQYTLFYQYFQLMENEHNGNFAFKKELIQNMLKLIIYNGIKLQCIHEQSSQQQARNTTVEQFIDLLDSQFPVDSPENPLRLKTPSHFAEKIHVHVNHLNHTVKFNTGKTTTQFINERVLQEAKDLLKFSDWSITEIGISLGFEYPQHFNTFFKKQTGKSPRTYKQAQYQNI